MRRPPITQATIIRTVLVEDDPVGGAGGGLIGGGGGIACGCCVGTGVGVGGGASGVPLPMSSVILRPPLEQKSLAKTLADIMTDGMS